jgi:hypothetical protein
MKSGSSDEFCSDEHLFHCLEFVEAHVHIIFVYMRINENSQMLWSVLKSATEAVLGCIGW